MKKTIKCDCGEEIEYCKKDFFRIRLYECRKKRHDIFYVLCRKCFGRAVVDDCVK